MKEFQISKSGAFSGRFSSGFDFSILSKLLGVFDILLKWKKSKENKQNMITNLIILLDFSVCLNGDSKFLPKKNSSGWFWLILTKSNLPFE